MVLLTCWLFPRASSRSTCCGTSRGRCVSCIACPRSLVTSGSTFGAPAVQTGSRRVSTNFSRPGLTTWSRSSTTRDANGSRCCSWAAPGWVRCLRRTRPERTAALVLVDTTARMRTAEGYPEGFSDDEMDAFVAMGVEKIFSVETQAPELIDDAGFRRWYERALRLGAAPDVQRRRFLAACNTDVRGVLGSVQTPTLVVGHQGAWMAAQHRYLAEHIPGASLVELEGAANILPFIDPGPILDATEEFLTDHSPGAPEPDRVLATVLFTDLVRLHAAGRRDGRPTLAEPDHNPRRARRSGARPIPRPGSSLRRRRSTRYLRWPGASNSLHVRDPRRPWCPRLGGTGRSAHG